MEKEGNANTALFVPATTIPNTPVPDNGPGKKLGLIKPVTIVPPQVVEGTSKHGAIVVATLVSTNMLFDVVVKTHGFTPIATLSQLTSVVTKSWIFGKTTLDLMENHGIERQLMAAAEKDTTILLRAVMLLMVRRIVKIDGFAMVGNMLSLFQFVKVSAVLAESQGINESAAFFNEIASIPIKVYSAVAALCSNMVDDKLREAIAIAVGEVLRSARSSIQYIDQAVKLTTRNVETQFYKRYGLWMRKLYMNLQLPEGVAAREVLLEWKNAI